MSTPRHALAVVPTSPPPPAPVMPLSLAAWMRDPEPYRVPAPPPGPGRAELAERLDQTRAAARHGRDRLLAVYLREQSTTLRGGPAAAMARVRLDPLLDGLAALGAVLAALDDQPADDRRVHALDATNRGWAA